MKKLVMALLSSSILIGCGRQNFNTVMSSVDEVSGMNYAGQENKSIRHLNKNNSPNIKTATNGNKFLTFNLNNRELYTMDLNGSNKKQITFNKLEEYDASFSPDGKSIAFIGNPRGEFNYALYKVNADGTDLKKLTEGFNYISAFDWSPDSSKLGYSYIKDNVNDIRDNGISFIDLKNNRRSELATTDQYNLYFHGWTADQKKIIFQRREYVNEIQYLILQNLEDSSQEIIDTGYGPDQFLINWSANRQKIVYSRQANDTWELYTMNLAEKTKVRLTNNNFPEYDASWSPDGRKLLFVADSEQEGIESDYTIRTIDSDGSNQKVIVKESKNMLTPMRPFFLNNQEIVYNAFTEGLPGKQGNAVIYKKNLLNNKFINLTDFSANFILRN
jgi:Tol biopolymer transport system component